MCNRSSADFLLRDVAALESAEAGDVSVYSDAQYAKSFAHTHASVVITNHKLGAQEHDGTWLLLTANPRLAFAQVGHLFYPPAKLLEGVQPPTPVHPTAEIGVGTQVSSGATIGTHCQDRRALPSIGPECS